MNVRRRSSGQNRADRQVGFTLLEVLVVVICVAILAALVALYRAK